jgi:DNA-binding response OmpR family regulator
MTIAVLYVDDEPDLCEIAVMSLELDPEFQVRSCGSGSEALALLRQWRPAIVLLDVMMPGLDGPATFAAIRREIANDLPIAFATARTQVSDVARLMALGAVGVIAKPFNPLRLAADVRGLLPP